MRLRPLQKRLRKKSLSDCLLHGGVVRVDNDESDWSPRAERLVWKVERRYARLIFSNTDRVKRYPAFWRRLSRGGFEYAVLVQVSAIWAAAAAVLCGLGLVPLLSGLSSKPMSALEIMIGLLLYLLAIVFMGVTVQRQLCANKYRDRYRASRLDRPA
jgi:hypothetical protein